jgi:transposase-like protein
MRKPKKHYTAEQKLALLRRHLIEKVPVSDLCEEQGLQPTVFYRWQKELFENGAAALERKNGRREAGARDAQARRIEALRAKLARKDEVLAELMEEHVALKKSLGEI